MPGLDGTGPRSEGPMTGRGEGYCAIRLSESGEPAYGYAGVQGTPVRLDAPVTQPVPGADLLCWPRPMARRGGAFRHRHGRRGGRGRGRRFVR